MESCECGPRVASVGGQKRERERERETITIDTDVLSTGSASWILSFVLLKTDRVNRKKSQPRGRGEKATAKFKREREKESFNYKD
jgi:hypothetical protein